MSENAGFRLAKKAFALVKNASGRSFDSGARLKAKLQPGKSMAELINNVSCSWTISELGTHFEFLHQDSIRFRSASLNNSDSLIECFILPTLDFKNF